MAYQSLWASSNQPNVKATQKQQDKDSGINKVITHKLKGDILQCFSHGSNRDKFCDFTVVVGVTEFPCHRFVLSACSGFFEALMRSDMKERREMKATIHGITPEIFNLILDVIYGNSEALVPDKMIEIWKAAHQLQIQFLISACEHYFMENINADNCYLIYTHAQLLQSKKVSSSVLNYMVQNFVSVVQSQTFVKLDYDDFLLIFQNKNVQICADFQIEAIMKWCEYESKKSKSSKPSHGCSRLQFLGVLIQAVDLAKLTTKCLASLLTNPVIQGDKIANAAVNSQAAKNMIDPMFNGNRRYYNDATGWGNMSPTIGCKHCKSK